MNLQHKHSGIACDFPELHKELQRQQELVELRQLSLFPLHLCVLTELTRGGRCVYNCSCYFQICFFYELLIFTMLLIIQFYTKLEEKHKALEAEKDEAEARKKVITYFLNLICLLGVGSNQS